MSTILLIESVMQLCKGIQEAWAVRCCVAGAADRGAQLGRDALEACP